MMRNSRCSLRTCRNVLSALLVLLALAACDTDGSSSNGGGGGGAAGFVGMPPAAQNGAPAGTVNAANAGNARFEVTVGPEYGSGFNVFLIVTDSMGNSMTLEQPSPAAGGVVAFENVNLTSFNEGQLNVMFELRGPSGATAASSGFTITLDANPPTAPTALFVNSEVVSQDPLVAIPANTVNSGNVQSTPVRIQLPQGFHQDDKIMVFAEVGSQVLELGTVTAPDAAGSVDLIADFSAVPDGMISLTALLTDTAGNETLYTGTAANKDVFVGAPATPSIPVGPQNPVEVVNAATQMSADLTSTFSSAGITGDKVYVVVSDGIGSITSPLLDFSTPGAPVNFSGVNLSSLSDGPITYTAYALDLSGNRTPSASVAGLKDVIIGTPTTASINGATNINASNVTALSFDVARDANTASGDQVQISLDDGTNPVVVVSGTLGAGSGTQLVGPGNVSALNDGFIATRVRFSDSAGNSNEVTIGNIAKDSTPPGSPQSVSIASSGQNAANVVNSATLGNVTVTAQANASNEPSRTITVVVTDGAQSMTFSSVATSAGQTLTWANQDFSGFSDGPLTLTAIHEDPFGNTSAVVTQMAVVDRVAAAPTMVTIPSGMNNAGNTITAGNEGAVSFDFTFPSSSVGTDVVTATLSDGVNSVSLPNQTAPNGGGLLTVGNIDASTLNDGTVSVSGVVTDAAGNSAVFGPVNFTKSTTPVVLPASIRIALGTNNPIDGINLSNVGMVNLEVVWDNSMVGTEVANFTISDSVGGSINFGPRNPPAGGGTNLIGFFNASSLADGPISIAINLANAGGASSTGSGTSGLKDTILPVASTGANVDAGTNNAQDVINLASVNAVSLTATFGPSARSDEQARIVLTDSNSATVTTPPMSTAMGGGPVTWSNIDCSSLTDGNISLSIEVIDLAENLTSSMGSMALKDTQTGATTMARVGMTANNPQDFINSVSANQVTVTVSVPGSYVGTESVVIEIRDTASGLVSSAAQTAPAGGTMTFANLDCSALLDGTITVDAVVTDAATNTITHSGISAMKDIILPIAPMGLVIDGSLANNVNQINVATVGMVSSSLTWDASMAGDETAVITITDSSSAVAMASVTSINAGGGSALLPNIDASALADGAVTVAGVLSDPAGNTVAFSGAAATKDATPPGMPTSVGVIVGSSNPANYINIASESAPVIDAIFTAGSATTDTLDLVLSDTVNTVSITGVSGVNMAGTVQFTGVSAATLVDGPITLDLTITDDHLNSINLMGTQAIKDTVDPVAPTYTRVEMTSNNPVNFVNIATVAAAQVDVDLPTGQGYTTGDSLVVTITDSSSGTALSSSVAAGNDGGISSASVNCSSLAAGALALSVEITDAAGNAATFAGTAAELDIASPTPPTGVGVAVGTNNAQNVINSQNAGSTMMDVVWDGSAVVTDSATFTFTSSGGGMAITSSLFNPAGTGAEVVGPIDLSALADGTITITGSYSDQAGNPVAFTGTSATKTTSLPVLPTAASVQSGANNASDIINIASVATIDVEVTFDGTSTAGNTVKVVLIDSAMARAESGTQMTTGGAEMMSFTVDASGILDGAISVVVEVTDSSMSLASFTGMAASKDTVAPVAPSSAGVVMTMNNPAGFINDASKAAVSVEVVLDDSTYIGGETVAITLTGPSSATATAGPTARPMGSATVAFASIDCSGLMDGTVTLSMDIVDTAGNPATISGTSATKDIVAPTAPSLTRVASSANNAVDFINNQNEGALVLDVTWDASMEGTESAQVLYTDGSSATAMSPVYSSVPNGGGADTMPGGTVASLADSTIALSMTLTDAAGNSTPFGGTNATKDTAEPDPATAANVDSGANNSTDIINASNASNFSVTASFGASSVAANMIRLRLIDSMAAEVSTTPVPAPVGVGNHQWNALDTSALTDGIIQIVVEVQSTNGNVASFSGGTMYTGGMGALQDQVAPATLTSVSVPVGMNNPVHFINAGTAGTVSVEVVVPASYGGTESIIVTCGDGVNSEVVTPAQTAAMGGGTLTFTANVASLNDGTITLTATATDLGENATTTSAGTDPTKDVVAPALATAVVLRSLTNPENVINASNVASLTIRTNWGATTDTNDTFAITLSDGVSTDVTASGSAPASTGDVDTTSIDASGLEDGFLTLTVVGSDAAGNTATLSNSDIAKQASTNVTRYVYSANFSDNTIGIYLATSDGVLHPQGFALSGTSPLSVATDNGSQWLYAANSGSDSISAYAIEADTGRLTSIGDVASGDMPENVVVDPYGRFVYASNVLDNNISVYSINQSTGALTAGAPFTAGTTTRDMVIHPNGQWAYVVNTGDDTVWSVSIDPTTGALTQINSLATESGPEYVEIHPNGEWAYVVSNNGMVQLFTIGATGALTAGAVIAVGAAPTGMALSESGKWAIVVSAGAATIQAYAINNSTGALTSTGSAIATGANPRAVQINSSNNLVYVANGGSASISIYDLDDTTGAITLNGFAPAQNGPHALELGGGAGPVGFVIRYAPVVNQVSSDIAVHSVNDTTGALAAVGSPVSTGTMADPVDFVIHPTNQWMYVVNQADNEITTFSFNESTGAVAEIGSGIATGGLLASALTMDLSGRFLYVANTNSDDIQAYSINQSTGVLTAVGSPVDTGAGTNPGALSVHTSGRFLYSANGGNDTYSVFTINGQTGALTQVGTATALNAGVLPNDVQMHPSGQWAYFVCRGSGSVETYNVDSATGALSFANGVSQGAQPWAMVVNTSGAFAYVTSKSTGDTQAYTVSSVDGSLTAVGSAISTGTDTRSLAIDPRSDFLYVADFASGGTSLLSIFTINSTTGALTAAGTQSVAGMGTSGLQLVIEIQ